MSCILVLGSGAAALGFFRVFSGEPRLIARVAELVDALDLGSSGVTRESSSLSFRTIRAAHPGLLLPDPRSRWERAATTGLPTNNDQQV